MKKMTQLFATIALLAAGAFSCTKPGCTDERALNYSVDAKDDDGSCTYRGDITFWCLPAVSETLLALDHDTLRFVLEGELVDSIATEFFFSPSGECNTPGVMTIPRDTMPYFFRNYKYYVYGEDFEELYNGFIRLDANECFSVQLE